MSTDPVTGIRILDTTLDYADTSEDRVLATLERASDRSSESDELADAMVDWPTRYHFSRMRGHLIRPFALDKTFDVLDVGCGTGAVTRAIGETGAGVLGVEGALPRARAAALRCADLNNVEIVCGDVSHLGADRTFDLACLVGVLEYAAATEGGGHGPEALLEHLRKLVKPGGAVLVAIENQIGLKYLLGYREDHVGLPWAGIEDYAEGFGARTWSKRQLGRLLTNAGFAAHRWFFPFPDYKLPATILSEAAFELSAAEQFVDQVVGRPVHDFAFPRTVVTDDRRVHRVFLEAGLGPEIANSFLVLASDQEHTLDTLADRRSLAWILGGERRQLWKRTQIVMQLGGGLRVSANANSGDAGDKNAGWLTQDPERDDPWHQGPTIEQLALEACHQRDEPALAAALKLWTDFLSAVQTTNLSPGATHPFAPAKDGPALPADMLDVSPSNFVLTAEGVEFIDREWRVPGGVDPLLAGLRALWFFALDLVHGGARHPWTDDLSVDQLCGKMADLCGLSARSTDLNRMHRAEAELQSLVIGFDQVRVTRDLRESGRATLTSPGATCPLRWTHLHELGFPSHSGDAPIEKCADAEHLSGATPKDDADQTLVRDVSLERSLESARRKVIDLETRLELAQGNARFSAAEQEDALATLRRNFETLQARNNHLESLLPVKLYKQLRWLFSGK